MQISIEYCGTCNYRPIAAALAMAIRQAFGIDPILVHSTRTGAFEVSADGETISSKLASGKFPAHDAVVETLRKRRGPS